MKFVTAAAMRQIEKLENEKGVSYDQMMTDAGNRAAELLVERFQFGDKEVTVLCGHGNNGGDGFVVAARLAEQDARVTVVLIGGEPSTQAATMAFAALPDSVQVLRLPMDPELLNVDFLIDAIYGIGFHGEPSGQEQLLFARCGVSPATKIALDLSSGVEGDTGRYVSCFRADVTIAMGVYKPAHLVRWQRDFGGELLLAETPLTVAALQSGLMSQSLEPELCSLPERDPWSHKGNNGRLAVVCGSRSFPGAAMLACGGALRSGVGYVRLLSTRYVCELVAARFPEVIYTPLPENAAGGIDRSALPLILPALNGCDAILAGCGLGHTEDTAGLVQAILAANKKPLLLDADGINSLNGNLRLLVTANCPVVLTPHLGEFFRLAWEHINSSNGDYTLAAERFSAETNATLLLKDAVTGIFRGKRQPVFSFGGNDGLAKAGSGDLLSGIIASLMAQGAPTQEAALCGVWLHGRSAELAAQKLNRRWMQPSDLLVYLEQAFAQLEAME